MKRIMLALAYLAFLAPRVYAVDDVVSAVSATVKKVDAGTKTIVAETDKGVVHTFHYTDDLTIHTGKDIGKASDYSWKDIKVGNKVAVHYTIKGTDETAHEVDVLGKGGLKITKGTVTGIDRGTKFLSIKTADGTKETFKLTDRAAVDSGKGIAKGTVKTGKVTVYYTEDAGKKIAHFFEE